MKFSAMLLPLLVTTSTIFGGDATVDTKLEEATQILSKIVIAEQKHLENMGSYISASTSSEIRYNLEIEIPLDSYFNYTITFSNGCYRATAELIKNVGKANKGDRIIVTCDGAKEVLPSYSALKKYTRAFLKE